MHLHLTPVMMRNRTAEGDEMPAAVPGRNLYRLVAVSFGLLCILQASLNISLRLTLYSSKTPGFEDSCKIVTEERDELKRELAVTAHYSRQGWIYFSGSVYFISSVMKTWQESREDCLQKGADLMIINSKEEQNFTRQLKDKMWIGLTDIETEGTWKWVDGTPLTTSYWARNEPNSHGLIDEDCGEVRYHEKENNWNDKPCDFPSLWICEKKVLL